MADERSRVGGQAAGKDRSGAAGAAFGQIAPKILNVGDKRRGGFSQQGKPQIQSNTSNQGSTGSFAIETSNAPISDEEMAAINQGYQNNSGQIGTPGETSINGIAGPVAATASDRPKVNYNKIDISGKAAPSTRLNDLVGGVKLPEDIGLNDSSARASQQKLLDLLEQASLGRGPSAAQATLQAGNEANIRAALAQSASSKGSAQTATARQAVASGALANQQTANQAAILRAQEMQAAYELNARVADSIRNTDVSIQTANMGKNLQIAVEQGRISSDEAKLKYTEEVAVEKENVANQLRVEMANTTDALERDRIKAQLEIAEKNAKAAKDVAGIQAAAAREAARTGGRTKPTDILSALGSVAAGAGAMGVFKDSKPEDPTYTPDTTQDNVPMSEGGLDYGASSYSTDYSSPSGGGMGPIMLTSNSQSAAASPQARVQPAPQYSAADVRSNPQARLAMLQRMGLA